MITVHPTLYSKKDIRSIEIIVNIAIFMKSNEPVNNLDTEINNAWQQNLSVINCDEFSKIHSQFIHDYIVKFRLFNFVNFDRSIFTFKLVVWWLQKYLTIITSILTQIFLKDPFILDRFAEGMKLWEIFLQL